MPNRSPQGDSTDQPATEPMPVWTPPQPGSYERRDASTKHRHDGGREEFHYQGDLPHYHDDDSGILVFDPAAEAPNSVATEADPTPATSVGDAATPDAARASEPALTGGSGGEAGSGRPIVVPASPVAVVHVPFDPTGIGDPPPVGPAPEGQFGELRLTQFEALRITTLLSEVASRLRQPSMPMASKQECRQALLLLVDQLTQRTDQAYGTAWRLGSQDGAA